MRLHLILFGCALAAACSASKDSRFGDDDSSGSGANGSGASSATGFTVGAGGAGGSDGCTEENKQIYVVGAGNELYRFAPASLMFTPIGTISCPAGGATPFSMAVDRDGLAYVLFSDGNMFNVSTTDASCNATGFVPNQALGFDLFGMGFVSDGPNTTDETLFVGAYGGTGIGRIDTGSLSLTVVGNYDTLFGAAEITGTGDGRLYGFFQGTQEVVAEINKSTSGILSSYYPNVDIGDAWAFAFWGGTFYLFTNPNLAGSSQVDNFDPATNSTTTVVPSTGIRIVGAGVSTCAPIAPPK